MGDVDGGLLKCVLQLAACSDKLRVTDLVLGESVDKMRKKLSLTDLPVLRAQLAIVPVDSQPPSKSAKDTFQSLFDAGSEAAERLELKKIQLERELRRRSEHFQEIISSRNSDLQEEYKRMQKKLDDQAMALEKRIEGEKAKQQSHKRRRTDATTQAMKKTARRAKESMEQENSQLQSEVDSFSAEITRLQEMFVALEQINSAPQEDESATTAQEEDEQLSNQVASLRREVELLRDAKESIADSHTTSFKAQYETEKLELDDEVAHLNQVTDEIQKQLGSHAKRLHALVGTLAPNSNTGALMTRLYKQLMSDVSAGPRKTVDLNGFLKSCPSAEEGKRAINEMKKLQLIYCYESSGIIALAD